MHGTVDSDWLLLSGGSDAATAVIAAVRMSLPTTFNVVFTRNI